MPPHGDFHLVITRLIGAARRRPRHPRLHRKRKAAPATWGIDQPKTIPQSGSFEMPPRIDLPAFLLDIVMDGRRADHYRNRVAGARLRGAGYQTAERKRHLGRESKARRHARA
jgi:hypothetical protein